MMIYGVEAVYLGVTEESVNDALGTPLEIGSSWVREKDCTWEANILFLPPSTTGLDMYYQWDNTNYTSYASYLESVAAPNVVIDSIDLEPACDAIGVTWVQTTQAGGFDYKMDLVPPSQLQATVAADGTACRVVTAVTFDDASGNAVVISYGWQGDTTTLYEAQTVIATPSNVASATTTLADEGYFISAFCGNDAVGYILVGMRVKGDSLPRPITVSTSVPTSMPYYVPVVYLAESGAGTSVIYER